MPVSLLLPVPLLLQLPQLWNQSQNQKRAGGTVSVENRLQKPRWTRRNNYLKQRFEVSPCTTPKNLPRKKVWLHQLTLRQQV
jgi:hypothetical protein